MKRPQIAIVLGSASDQPIIQPALDLIKTFPVDYSVTIASAHRTPERVHEFVARAESQNVDVIIAGAGGAAHLPGVIASLTHIPVIGLPIPSQHFASLDSLLSMVQMPAGVPVAVMGVGQSGAVNAVIFSLRFLAKTYPDLESRLTSYKSELQQSTLEKARPVQFKPLV